VKASLNALLREYLKLLQADIRILPKIFQRMASEMLIPNNNCSQDMRLYRRTALVLNIGILMVLAALAPQWAASAYASAPATEVGTVLSLAVVPTNANIVYAGTYQGVFKTVDGGSNWAMVLDSSLLSEYPYFYSMVIDPTNNDIVYAGADADLYKTTNGGSSWISINPSSSWPYIYAIAIDPTNSNTLYAGSNYYGVYKTTNGGSSWVQINTGLPTSYSYILSLVIDPTNSNTLYAGGYNGIYKTTNGGSSWVQLTSGLPSSNPYFMALVIDPTNSNTLYTGSEYYGVYKTTNGGNSWVQLTSGLPSSNPEIRALAINPTNSSMLYAGYYYYGVYKTTNGGANWSDANTGLRSNDYIRAFAIGQSDPNTLYASSEKNGGGVFKTTNGGVIWSACGLQSPYMSQSIYYSGGTLTLNWTVETTTATTWNVWWSINSQMMPLISVPLPAKFMQSYSVPVAGFPQIGGVGFFETFDSNTTQGGIRLALSSVIDTGSATTSIKNEASASSNLLKKMSHLRR
jgi:photosystem II stability/assembly factor-like uncharacterized protein